MYDGEEFHCSVNSVCVAVLGNLAWEVSVVRRGVNQFRNADT